MSITHLSLVNQKLAFAKSIEHLLSEDVVVAMPQIQVQSLMQAFLSHLGIALHFYVRELAERYTLKNANSIGSVDELVEALSSVGKTASEADELFALIYTDKSWLAELNFSYKMLFKSPLKPKEKKAFVEDGLIELVDLSETTQQKTVELTLSLLSGWLAQFQILIDRQRDTSAEY